jgi:thioredoxin 1
MIFIRCGLASDCQVGSIQLSHLHKSIVSCASDISGFDTKENSWAPFKEVYRRATMNNLSFATMFLYILSALMVTSFSFKSSRIGCFNARQYELSVIGNILTPEEFESITTKSTSRIPCVIDFQKSECKPCKKIAPDYLALSDKYDGKVQFFKIDADTSKEALSLMKANGIKSVPTFHVWVAGNKVDTVQGAHLDEVEETLVIELNKISP